VTRLTRLVALAGLTLGILVVLAGVAFADDCSSPSDCSNTAWTVGGGAAVAGGLAAAAAASGLLPGSPEGAAGADGTPNTLSPECRQKLQGLLDRVNDQFAYVAELTTTLQGAVERGSARRMASSGGTVGPDGLPLPGEADLTSAGAGAAETAASSFVPSAASIQQAQVAAANAQQHAARVAAQAVSRRALADGLEQLLHTIDTSTVEGARTFQSVARELVAAQTRARAAEEVRRQASRMAQAASSQADDLAAQLARFNPARAATNVARGLGALAALYSAYSTHQTITQFGSGLRGVATRGALGAEQEILIGEFLRWRSFAAEVKARLDAALVDLNARMGAYNVAAVPCGAELLHADAHAILDRAMYDPGRVPVPAGAVPGRVIDPRPRELDEQGTPQDCTQYEAALQNYDRIADSVKRDLERWQQRGADLSVTKSALDQLIRETAAALESSSTQFEVEHGTAGVVTVAAAIAGLAGVITLGPALAIGAFTFFLASHADVSVRPEAEHLQNAVSAWRQERRWLDSRDGYIRGEVERLQRMVTTDLRQRHDELARLHARCAAAGGTASPPLPPGVLTQTHPVFGTHRTLQEVRQWR